MNEVRKKNLTNEERAAIIQFLLERSANKNLHRGAIREASEAFNVNRKSISQVWHRGLSWLEEGSSFMDGSSLKKKRCGRKRIDYQPKLDLIADNPLNDSSVGDI